MATPDTQVEDGEDAFRDEASLIWHAFTAPRNEKDFYQAWIALACRQMQDVTAGVVLLQSLDTNTFAPVAVWPNATRDLSFLGAIVQRALTERRGVVSDATHDNGARVHIAYPIETAQRIMGAVVLEANPRPVADMNSLLRQLHWNMGWLHSPSNSREMENLQQTTERIASVMEVVATALRQAPLQQTLFDVANQLAQQFLCSRVAIGLVTHGVVHIAALSNAASFEKQTNIVKRYAAAMEEAVDSLASVTYPPASENYAPDVDPSTAHARLAAETGAQALLSVPLQLGAKCIGVLALERNTNSQFTPAEVEWTETLATLLPSVIDQKRRADRGHLARAADDIRKIATRLFGPRHLAWKFGAALTLSVISTLVLVNIEYRVTTKTVIEGEVQRAAVAPFDGFVASNHVRAGDAVKKGQVLCELDTRDLMLERQKWVSERGQEALRLREAMATHDLSEIQALTAKVQEADAQLALVNERISRAKITSPFEGIVISGDLTQLIGSPVEQGKELFKIAPLEAYRVILQVDEKEIRHVREGQKGQLVISGIAGDPIAFNVVKLTPIATAQDGRNFFRVEAHLQSAPPRLRPGMEGIGKISVGERRLWWILTHSFVDWLRVELWNWTP